MDESMESGLQFWRMRRAVLAHSTTQTMQQFDEIFTEMKLEQSCCKKGQKNRGQETGMRNI